MPSLNRVDYFCVVGVRGRRVFCTNPENDGKILVKLNAEGSDGLDPNMAELFGLLDSIDCPKKPEKPTGVEVAAGFLVLIAETNGVAY